MTFVEGNDDTFIVLVFGLFASVCVILLIEPLVRNKAYYEESKAGWRWLADAVKLVITKPNRVRLGITALQTNKPYASTLVKPAMWTVLGKWRWFCWFVCLYLFVIVSYQKLTFDPYATLGVASSAPVPEIKRAYRQLSMRYHPDRNRTEEAKVIYAQVKKAWLMVTNPDDRELDQEVSDGTGKTGIGLPSFFTNPEYAVLSMTILMFVLFAGPFYMLFKLQGKTEKINRIPIMNNIAQLTAMAEPFYTMIGQPHNPRRALEDAERAKLTKFLRRLESSNCFETPESEIPIQPSEVAEHYRPELCSKAEVKQLLMDVINSKKGPSEVKLQKELCLYVNKDSIETLKRLIEEDVVPQEDVDQLAAVRAKGLKEMAESFEYTPPTEDAIEVGQYFLIPLVNQTIFELVNLFPKFDAQKDLALTLRNAYKARRDQIDMLKKQAEERAANPPATLPKFHRETFVRALESQLATDKLVSELLSEMIRRCKLEKRGGKRRGRGADYDDYE